jgi:hypothetical protein
MKVIAHTTGAFQLLDGLSGDLISAHRPSVVKKTSFVTARLAIEQVKIVTEVPDAATDEAFAKHWKDSDGDIDLAVQSFLATFEAVEGEAAPVPAKKTSAKKQAAE